MLFCTCGGQTHPDAAPTDAHICQCVPPCILHGRIPRQTAPPLGDIATAADGGLCAATAVACNADSVGLFFFKSTPARRHCPACMQALNPAVLTTSGAAVERWQPSSGARSTLRSRWPARTLLCMDCRQINGAEVVVASGEAVPQPREGDAAPARPPAAAEEESSAAGGGGLFAAGGLETAGRRKRKSRQADAGVRDGAHPAAGVAGGGSMHAQHSVPSAVGRSPLEVWQTRCGD